MRSLVKFRVPPLRQVVDRREIEWARSSQEAAESRLEALIADFESQRAADAGTTQALHRTLESKEEELAATCKARDEACRY